MSALAVLIGAGGVLFGVALVYNAVRRPAVDAAAVLADLNGVDVHLDEYTEKLSQPLGARILAPLAKGLGGTFKSFLPGNYLEGLRRRLMLAGLAERLSPEEFLVIQLVSLIGGAGLGYVLGHLLHMSSTGVLRMTAFLAIIGVFVPESRLGSKREDRQGSIRRDLPDVLDLLVISVEAGVGLEGAIEVVGRHFDSPLSHELNRMLREMELGVPRRTALQNLRRRVDMPEVSNFVLSLMQADALGMPLGRVLRTQANEMRSKRRQWAREKAAKLPVKILFPMFLFIFPALFVVVLGPAVSSILQNVIHGIGH
ncbi:MAG: type II secretion system F family protein [Actinobacteria bacterium]|nr:MAG: type II secretion system F family protein [Actinomycetota bacterium]